jgi:hypothetical protein
MAVCCFNNINFGYGFVMANVENAANAAIFAAYTALIAHFPLNCTADVRERGAG